MSECARVAFLEENPNGSPAVLLLHGLGATAESWQLQFPALVQAGFHVLAPDVPGFGTSRWDGSTWSIRGAARRIAEQAAERAGTALDVVGISMGGTIALRIALDYPEQVRRLVLVNTFARLRPRSLTELLYYARRVALVYGRGLPAQAEFVARRIFPDADQAALRRALVDEILQADERIYRQAMRALGFFDVADRLRQIRKPTLVVSGSRDTTVALEAQRALAAGIPGARHLIISGGGHGVTADHPEEFNRILLEFLQAGAAPI